MEEQKEELEVLDAIYGGDPKFTQLSENHFQYKFGEDGEDQSFVLDITWPEDYPCVVPKFTLDTFYNSLLSQPLKAYLLKAIDEESAANQGEVQTYSMIEWVRENREILFTAADLANLTVDTKKSDRSVAANEKEAEGPAAVPSSSTQKKEQLTKSQKRREWDKKEGKGDDEGRGRDWVDVVKHLSQTGKQDEGS